MTGPARVAYSRRVLRQLRRQAGADLRAINTELAWLDARRAVLLGRACDRLRRIDHIRAVFARHPRKTTP